ncbi:class I SAM-dependent rRNA methyltransferase [Brumimicrobium aurantiacum]|uniref:Class I SAM-dependent rRNA methyltransferase n=1 Tax=Brumimicrobium aurantiacum TaxID=1737063 RepID=A0A3E1EUV2_9FLAO|nr:class I SAM-dependent rRNA methyltransferase [Brumimicrobium aurantiacum]RFC53349.1 class I SAM-dependent rRNA methyltransferase [Brumimicrobium aurantiacum]
MKIPTLAIKLNKAGERAVKQGHPWIFENSIEKGPKDTAIAGSLCVIFDQRYNKPIAFGLWDPEEIIRIKLILLGNRLQLNGDFWSSQLRKAHSKRQNLIKKGITGYRGIHGENDHFPGLILDVYQQVGVLKIYSNAWKPHLDILSEKIKEVYGLKTIVIRFSRKIQMKNTFPYEEGDFIGESLSNEKIVFEEYGVKYYAYTQSGHKTGFFLDQRPNRHWVQKNAKGKRVLDVFSYVGGFGIHALKGGAESLTSVDISQHAMNVAEENIQLNNFDQSKWNPITADAFIALEELIEKEQQFDIVIIDPPSFAKQGKEVESAAHQYERLARLGRSLTDDKGVLILGSCSSRISLQMFEEIHHDAGITSKDNWKYLHYTLHDDDHPIEFAQSNYLKTIFYQKQVDA